jgi:hypothetical protein
MERRDFLTLALSLSVGTGALLTGCGGGGGGGNGTVATRKVRGTVAVPATTDLPRERLRVATGAADVGVASDGGFDAQVLAASTGPTLAWAHVDGKAALLGFLDEAHATIDAASTAVALLYFAFGGYAASVQSKPVLLDRLRAHAATAALADVLAARIAVNPTALPDGDPAVGAALKTAFDTISAERPSRSRPTSRGRQVPDVLMLLTPDGAQSNVVLNQGTAPQTIVATNQARRYCQVMTYEIDREDENGVRANPPKAKLVSSVFLPATPALGFLSTTTGFFSGQTAFVPVTTDPIALSMNVGDAKTYFETVVLGASSLVTEPPVFGEFRYVDEVAKWREIRQDLNLSSWLADVVLGLLLEILGARDYAVKAGAVNEAVRQLKSTLYPNYLALYEAASNGNFSGAVRLFLEFFSRSPVFIEDMLAILVIFSPTLRSFVVDGTLASTRQLLTTAFNSAFAAAGLLLGAGDLVAVLWDLAHGEPAERWQETLIDRSKVGVKLAPSSATIAPGDSLSLAATVTGNVLGRLHYAWSVSGALVNLSDGTQAGTSFESDRGSVTLATTPSTQGTVTVTVVASAVGTDGARRRLGEATAAIEVNDDVPYGAIRIKFPSFDAGDQTVTGATRTLVPYQDPTKQLSQGIVFVGSVHWKLLGNGNHDGLRMNIEFDSATTPGGIIQVGSRAQFRDDYGMTLQLATGPNTEIFLKPTSGTLTVTGVVGNAFSFTMNAQLIGLRGVTTTATANLKGWIVGY